jgi:N6-L-threonylcarbamoyladenine synthase
MPQPLVILGIETSCDETAVAVVSNNKVLANCVHTQTQHAQYGGVVPELASRAHQQKLPAVLEQALHASGVKTEALDGIAYTHGPGLLGALLVGASFARGLSLALRKPCIAVHHMEAHIQSLLIPQNSDNTSNRIPSFPFLCLTVSGGHSQLVKVNSEHAFELLGETIDDAAGEAFDKVSKILGLPYPGGPLVDAYASKGNPKAFRFPIAKVPELDFSFSGFKTSFLYFYERYNPQRRSLSEQELCDLCASAQHAIVEELLLKLRLAIRLHPVKNIAIAGGVSANSSLRQKLLKIAEEMDVDLFLPRMEYCTDNAGMIAYSGMLNFGRPERINLPGPPLPRWPMGT